MLLCIESSVAGDEHQRRPGATATASTETLRRQERPPRAEAEPSIDRTGAIADIPRKPAAMTRGKEPAVGRGRGRGGRDDGVASATCWDARQTNQADLKFIDRLNKSRNQSRQQSHR